MCFCEKFLFYFLIRNRQLILKEMRTKLLIAFDFDHTIVDDNSDIVVRKLVHDSKIPLSVRQIYKTQSWTAYMQEIFKILHNHGVTPAKIIDSVKNIRPVPFMLELFQFLKANGCEVIIISDSNSIFINEWLQHYNLKDIVSEVFTNPAHFDHHNTLKIEMYHKQSFCNLSAVNLCKGFILEQYQLKCLENGKTFETVAYVGDGKNDFCPCTKLRATDFIFARAGYPLSDMLKKSTNDIKAKHYDWSSAKDILDVLF